MPAPRALALALPLVVLLLLLPSAISLRPNLDLEHSALSAEAPFNKTQIAVNGTAATAEVYHWQYVTLPFLMVLTALSLPYIQRDPDATAAKHAEEEKTAGSFSHQGFSMHVSPFEVGAIKFGDQSMEENWIQYSHYRNLRFGSRLMAAATVAVAFERVMMILDRQGCEVYDSVWLSYVSTFAILGIVLVLCIICSHHPSDFLYWPLVAFYAVAAIALNLPPFSFNCQELREVEAKCAEPARSRYTVMKRKLDCELQGHTALQMLMLYLLMLPYLLPRFNFMHLGWIWIVVFYFGTILVRRFFITEPNEGYEDMALHVAMLGAVQLIASLRKYRMEREQRGQFVEDLEEKQASKDLFNILKDMVPQHVIKRMLDDEDKIADEVNQVSILFIVINDFDRFASSKTPEELLEFLNDIFSKMDDICKANRVTKIETVAEEYVCCVGVVPEDIQENEAKGHAVILERLFHAADQILQLQDKEVQFKMGMHTGPIVAGVIGSKLPRFRLFGDTINTAARMMQKCLPGQLQFGEATKREVPPTVPVKLRGEVDMKGKGTVTAYVFDPLSKTPASDAKAGRRSHASKRGSVALALWGEEAARTADLAADESKEAANAAEDFEEVVEVEVSEDQQGPKTSKSFILSEKDGFTEEQEEKFQTWFHVHTVCFAFAARMDVQALLLATLTTAEAVHMEMIHIMTKPDGQMYRSEYRLSVFLATRFLCFAILLGWRFAASSMWFRNNARLVQWGLLASCCTNAALLFLSYDAAMVKGLSKEFFDNPANETPFNQQLSLVFLVMYFVTTSAVPLLFYPSCSFIPLAMLLMLGRHKTCIYLSQMGMVLFILTSGLTVLLAHEMEQTSRARFKAKYKVSEKKDRIEHILNTLMPPLLVQALRLQLPHSKPPSHHFKLATIAQSDLCGFTELASTRTPREVVGFISDLFGRFDELTEWHFDEMPQRRRALHDAADLKGKRGVYKVETIGDAYIAGHAEQPLTVNNSPVTVLLFGLDMIRATAEWSAALGVNVKCRVGVHHGECVGGIVGTGMMRYHLFGQFMTQLDTLEATSQEGVAQLSAACKEAVLLELQKIERTPEEVFGTFEPRTEAHLKTSKGEVHEFEEVGGKTYLVRQGKLGAPSST